MNHTAIIRIFLLCLPLLLSFDHSFAQTCGTKEVNEKLLQQHPEYKSKSLALKQEISDRIAAQSARRGGEAFALYTVPVVVHVIHLGEAVGNGSNISSTQIQNAITEMNNRFANSTGQGVDMGIEFCLAVRDPNGNPTTGINRVNGSSVADYTAEGIEWDGSGGANEADVKLLSIWPRADYYNIWVVHNIYGSIAGYAYYPTDYPLEGVVIEAGYMSNTSTILTHEMGHAFDLAHTFEGDDDGNACPDNTDCALDGDLICDTPPHKRGDCGTTNPCTTSGTFANSRFNYMSYCGSTNRFTANQQDRAEAAVNSIYRTSLLASMACVASTCSTACADADPCTQNLCTNGVCSYPNLNCDDDDACTIDVCNNIECFYLAVDCADEDECTADFCQDGCVNQLADCSDGDACTDDYCDEGICFNEPVDCGDADACTTDECEPQHTGIVIDYDLQDELTQPVGGTYGRNLWQLNSHFADNSSNTGKLEWAVTRFNWLHDAATQQQYLYSENSVRIDSLDITVAHQKGGVGADTILIVIYEDENGIAYDNQYNILNPVLHVDTIITSVSLSPDANTPVVLRVHPGLQLQPGERFMVGVHFNGSLSSTFNIAAGYGNRCSGNCAAYSLFAEDNSFWKIIYWIGAANYSGVNNLYYNCNSNQTKDRANCEGFYIQNFAISAHVTLLSQQAYECVHTPEACLITLSGAIRTETDVPVPGVTVTLSGDAGGSVVTGIDGLYSFQVPSGGDYTVTPSKNNDVTTNNGITTGDITLIRRHVLGHALLNSPYKIIAADGSGNSTVATVDISFVRPVILTGTSKFPNDRLWEFVSASQTFAGPPYDPFPFTKTRTYTNLTQSTDNQDFIGVKIGDVNNSWISTTP